MREPGMGSTATGRLWGAAEFKKRRIIVAFDEATFAQIRQMAVECQTSFAEQVRGLVEKALKESAA